jgi:hypothetical protein
VCECVSVHAGRESVDVYKFNFVHKFDFFLTKSLCARSFGTTIVGTLREYLALKMASTQGSLL